MHQPQASSSSTQEPPPLVWFQLYDANGQPYKDTTPSSVFRSSCPVVDLFRKAVKAEYTNLLSTVDSGSLLVYKNKAAFDKRNATMDEGMEGPLDARQSLGLLGSDNDVLIVAVPLDEGLKRMRITAPPFDPSSYKITFPFFDRNGEDYLTMLGRDDVVEKINMASVSLQKYRPIIISTSRGMGKTFLLKMIGLQRVRPELKNQAIIDAGSCGRIISYDFLNGPHLIQTENDAERFPVRLMIYFLCLLFKGTEVDGIFFEASYNVSDIVAIENPSTTFEKWLVHCLTLHTSVMIDEYIRLTNIAFKVDEKSKRFTTPPVFLFDEVQRLCKNTSLLSGTGRHHTYLSLMLSQLAPKHRAISISTGTKDGSILDVADYSQFIPKVLSLKTLTEDAWTWQYWKEMTAESNRYIRENEHITFTEDDELIQCLIYASYQIPRLLLIAHDTWFKAKCSNKHNSNGIVEIFEDLALEYYKEMKQLLTELKVGDVFVSVSDICNILLCCGVHWKVNNSTVVPGTNISWTVLIEKSIVFPYMDDCYVFPFNIVWRSVNRSKQMEIIAQCAKVVPNLDLNDLFLSFDQLNLFTLYNLGISYEKLFVSSLAVKYYLWHLLNPYKEFATFDAVYDFGTDESDQTRALLSNIYVNFSSGIHFPDREAFVSSSNLPWAIAHNKNHHNAHHDAILPVVHCTIKPWQNLPTKVEEIEKLIERIAISAKASLSWDTSKMAQQLKVSKVTNDEVFQLIWLYLGEKNYSENYPKVAFLNGSGVCNGFAIDLLIFMKKLKSKDNTMLTY